MNLTKCVQAAEIAKFWHYKRNIELFGGEIVGGKLTKPAAEQSLISAHNVDSTLEVWWKCEKFPNYSHHDHKMSICDKIETLGDGCIRCANYERSGNEEMLDNNDFVLACWDWDKNERDGVKLSGTTKSKNDKAWFICIRGHSKLVEIGNFSRNCGSKTGSCKYCANRVLTVENALINHPAVARCFIYEKNDFKPEDVVAGAAHEAWWRCDYRHEYTATCSNFTRSANGCCPKCSGAEVDIGVNSFDIVRDAKEWWDYEKNTIKITEISMGSHTKVWLKCPKGHSYDVECYRFTTGDRCPLCRGYRKTPGVNTFDTVPGAKEAWDYEKNTIAIDSITTKCRVKVWLWCKERKHLNHVWCYNFTNGIGCKGCMRMGYSKIAIEWLTCIEKRYNLKIQHAMNDGEQYVLTSYGKRYWLDGYIILGERKIAFEFNGDVFHGNPDKYDQDEYCGFLGKTYGQLYAKTLKKESDLEELGYEVISIWENDYKNAREQYLAGRFNIKTLE